MPSLCHSVSSFSSSCSFMCVCSKTVSKIVHKDVKLMKISHSVKLVLVRTLALMVNCKFRRYHYCKCCPMRYLCHSFVAEEVSFQLFLLDT